MVLAHTDNLEGLRRDLRKSDNVILRVFQVNSSDYVDLRCSLTTGNQSESADEAPCHRIVNPTTPPNMGMGPDRVEEKSPPANGSDNDEDVEAVLLRELSAMPRKKSQNVLEETDASPAPRFSVYCELGRANGLSEYLAVCGEGATLVVQRPNPLPSGLHALDTENAWRRSILRQAAAARQHEEGGLSVLGHLNLCKMPYLYDLLTNERRSTLFWGGQFERLRSHLLRHKVEIKGKAVLRKELEDNLLQAASGIVSIAKISAAMMDAKAKTPSAVSPVLEESLPLSSVSVSSSSFAPHFRLPSWKVPPEARDRFGRPSK